MKRLALLLFTIALIGCGHPSPAGVYETAGNSAADDAKFKMVLALEPDGRGTLTTNANVGDARQNQAIASVMSLSDGRWTVEKNMIALSGTRGDGKPMTYHFGIHESGDLMWMENAPARFHKRSAK